MLALWQDGEQSIGEVATRLSLPAHAIGPVVDRLQTSGLVQCVRKPQDRRSRLVRLTTAGSRLQAAAAAAQHNVVCQTRLSAPELQRLRDELHALADGLAEGPPGESERVDGSARPQDLSNPSQSPTTTGAAT